MNHNPCSTQHTPKQRLGLLSGPLLLSFALAVGACSSDDSASTDPSPAPTTTETPSSTVGDTSATTDDRGPVADISPTPNAVGDFFAELDALDFTGAVMAETPEGAWSASFGSADRSAGVHNEIDTVFDIGSLTKQFTAAAILRLEMDGRLSIDDSIGQYVPGLTTEQGEITVHQLLTHTSGLPHGLGPDDEAIALPDYVERLANTAFPASPVGEYLYSNVGYSLLGAVVETVTGDSYEVYLRDALFEPAGMLHTGYVLPDWTDTTIAIGYRGDESIGHPNDQPWDVDGPWWNLRANGGLLSTLPDLLRWDTALRGDEILDAAAKEKMYTPHVAIAGGDGAFSGYGWNLVPFDDGTTLITHAGGNGVFYADFYRFVDHGTTIVMASNVADPLAFEVGTGLATALLPDLFGDGACELDPMPVAATAGFDIVDDYPDTPAGRAMAAWMSVVLSGSSSDPDDASMLIDYVEQSIGEGFIDELGTERLTELIGALQVTLDGFEIERIAQEDDTMFHVVVADPDGNQAVVSTRVGAEARVDCIGFSN